MVLSMGEDDLFADLERVMAERERLAYEARKADARRDELVRDLMRTGAKRERIAQTSGLKLTRLYQILTGTRT